MKKLIVISLFTLAFMLLGCKPIDSCKSGGVSTEAKVESGSRYCP